MRLIDADALKSEKFYSHERHENCVSVYAIDMMPTVERPHGEWIDYSDEGYVECPFCGSATNCEDNIEELHYCFSCGAKMMREGDAE